MKKSPVQLLWSPAGSNPIWLLCQSSTKRLVLTARFRWKVDGRHSLCGQNHGLLLLWTLLHAVVIRLSSRRRAEVFIAARLTLFAWCRIMDSRIINGNNRWEIQENWQYKKCHRKFRINLLFVFKVIFSTVAFVNCFSFHSHVAFEMQDVEHDKTNVKQL